MSHTPIVAFFNNKGGVGKTTLVYHLAWMFAELGATTVAADLDPQANLTTAFVDEERLEILWRETQTPDTIFEMIKPLQTGTGDIATPTLEPITDHLSLLVGDLSLSRWEDDLSLAWPKALDEDERAFRIMSAFWRLFQRAASDHDARLVLVDLGPNVGAINRAALIAADYVVIPLAPDLFSLQGLRNFGPILRVWRRNWQERYRRASVNFELPPGDMQPIGYVVMQHSVRLDRPVKAYDRWMSRIPGVYREFILDDHSAATDSINDDTNSLATLKHYHSLMAMAQDARKPIFDLRPADGAIGAPSQAVRSAKGEFEQLARTIAQRIGLVLPEAIG